MKRSATLETKARDGKARLRILPLLIVAGSLHLALTITVFMLGRQAILPSTFDVHGTAISITPDAVGYREGAATITQLLRRGEFLTWYSAPYPLHLKLYSICFAIFGALTGFNILSAEPLNLLYYLGILTLIAKLGREVFSARAGLLAAATVGLWPSLLLHTTQLVKDPFYILGMLALIVIIVSMVTRTQTMRQSLLTGVAGGLIAAVLWIARNDLGPLLIATVILGAVTVVLRQVQLKRMLSSNLAGITLLVSLTITAILFLPIYKYENNPQRLEGEHAGAPIATAHKTNPGVHWWQVAVKVGIVRDRFVQMYPHAGSTIDPEVRLATNWDLLRYLPRAAAIGLFAPFPRMWFESGQNVGSGGRLVSGVETLFMYAVEVLALLGVWSGRRRLAVWLLSTIATIAVVSLALVVTNIGALYRLRYTFFILLIVLAAGGAVQVLDWSRPRFSLGKRIGA